jgi:hypothetical protein
MSLMPCFCSGLYLRSLRNLRLKMCCSFALVAAKLRQVFRGKPFAIRAHPFTISESVVFLRANSCGARSKCIATGNLTQSRRDAKKKD